MGTGLQRPQWLSIIDWWGVSFLTALAVVLPIAHFTTPRDACIISTAILWIVRSVKTKNWKPTGTLFDLPWALYGLFVVLSFFTAVDLRYSLDQFRSEYLKNYAVLFLVVQFVTSEKQVKTILLGLVIGNLLMVSTGIIDFLVSGGSFMGRVSPAGSGWASLHSGGGTYSTYLLTVLPFLFCLLFRLPSLTRHRWAYTAIVVLLAANLFSLYITFQRGAWVAFFVMLFISAVLVPTKKSMKAISVLSVAGLFLLSLWCVPKPVLQRGNTFRSLSSFIEHPEKFNIRLELWKDSWSQFWDNPWTGTGFGQRSARMKYDFLRKDNTHWHAHNMLFNVGLQLGVGGLLAFLFLWFRLFQVGWQHSKCAGPHALPPHPLSVALFLMSVAVFFRNMFDDFFVDDTAILFWLLTGVTVAAFRSSRGGTLVAESGVGGLSVDSK